MRKIKELLIVSFLLLPVFGFANTFDALIDDEIEDVEGLQASGKSNAKGNILAVPIPVLNPTIGTGLQAVVLYLHPDKLDAKDSPNATSGVGAMYTDSESWVVGLFHDNYLFSDRLRVRAVIGTGELNLNYFGSGSDPIFADNPVKYSLKSDVLFVQTLGRIPKTQNWFGGLRITRMAATIGFDLGELLPGLPVIDKKIDVASLGLIVNYDTRDENYYPTTGRRFEAAIDRDDESWGSDYSFDQYSLSYNHYFSINAKNVIAVRVQGSEVVGDAPFFLQPTLKMRGFASGLYQDNAAMSAHLEWRHKFHPRWGFMTSFETGVVADSITNFDDSRSISSVGAGLRWQVSANKPMHLGIDVGVSQDDKALYIQIGEKF